MSSVDEYLSMVTCIAYVCLMMLFIWRFVRSRWGIYFYLMIFVLLRIVAYAIRTYIASGAIKPTNSHFATLYTVELILISVGVVFILKLLSKLYEAILPKARSYTDQESDLFERYPVQRTRYFLTPLMALVVAGAVLSTHTSSPSDQHTGLVIRQVGVCLMALLGAWYLVAAWNYRIQHQEKHKRAFTIAFMVTVLFDISLVYKVVYTFYDQAASSIPAYFILAPLTELIGLCILSVDLHKLFMGIESKTTQDMELGR